jgi:FMNH2-dependent dimethyl sulfone monooxygenase
MLRLGVWTPLPHTIATEPAIAAAIDAARTPGTGRERDLALDLAIEVLKTAERYGFDLTLVAERLLGPDHEAWILASALACHTRHLEIMVAVHPGVVPPQVVAKMGATLDRISRGRCSINVVNGWWAEEMNLFGNGAWLPSSQARYQRMDEFIQVVRGLWTTNAFRFAGQYFQTDGQTLPIRPVQSPCPPIYAASRSDIGKDIIARHCDWWFAEYDPDHRRFAENFGRIARDVDDMRARSTQAGRALRYGLSAHVVCADTIEAAWEKAAALEAYGARDRIALSAVKALGAGLVGTPEVIAERIHAYERVGVECLMLRFHPILKGLEDFAEQVLPLLGRVNSHPSPDPNPAVSAATQSAQRQR